jgi:hypothetical protein
MAEKAIHGASRGSRIGVVQAAQDGDGMHATACRRASGALPWAYRDLLLQALLWVSSTCGPGS